MSNKSCFAQDCVAGVDEAGRGPLAGPVVAAAVILPDGHGITGLGDSKKLSAAKRAKLRPLIESRAWVGVGAADTEEIDRINILQATYLAMQRAVAALPKEPKLVLVDGNRLPQWEYKAQAIIGGDGIEAAISAASIIAKEVRDAMMLEAHAQYPDFGWDRNKGYGTAEHRAALEKFGPSPLHRRSFAPVAQLSML